MDNKKKRKNNKYYKKKYNYYSYNKGNNRNYYYHKKHHNQSKENHEQDNKSLNNVDGVKEILSNNLVDDITNDIDNDINDYNVDENDNINNASTIKFNKKILGYLLLIALALAFILGSSYAFFNYQADSSQDATLTGANMYVQLRENLVNLNLNGIYPRTNEEARSLNNNYVDFTIDALNTSNKTIYYQIVVSNGAEVNNKVRINPEYVMLDLMELDEYDNATLLVGAKAYSSFYYQDMIAPQTGSVTTKKYRLRMWISDDLVVGNVGGATYTQAEYANLYANVQVSINSYDGSPPVYAATTMRNAIETFASTNNCTPTVTAVNGSSFGGAGNITYFNGTEDCVNFNYVWYSGKLWRITAIYPDGTMKLVTENNITSIAYGSDITFNNSYADQWLSQEFLPTLYNNSRIVVQNAEWNFATTSSTATDPYSLENPTLVNRTVGLLNSYEYAKSGSSSTYLNIAQLWWLNSYSATKMYYVKGDGTVGNTVGPRQRAYGLRPAIYLRPDVEFQSGNYDGTRTKPYRIVGDLEEANTNSLLNRRVSGEYLMFNNELYRIVDIDNKITKIVKADYIRDNDAVVMKKYSTDLYYNTISANSDYWDYYLKDNSNSGWLPESNRSLLVEGTFYQEAYSYYNYKGLICETVNDNISARNCKKISTGNNKLYTGYVGLLRIGEIFSSQQTILTHNSSKSVLVSLTPAASRLWYLNTVGNLLSDGELSTTYAIRPAMYLKSTVKITGGNGYMTNPYTIS